MFKNYLSITLLLVLSSSYLFGQVTVTYPKPYIVIQRDNDNWGTVHISGTLSETADRVEARFIKKTEDPGESTGNWFVLDNQIEGNGFYGQSKLKGGRYQLEVRAMKGQQQVGSVTKVENVGVGEVFLIVGHSNAQGSGGTHASSDLVVSMDINANRDKRLEYELTANPELLPKEFSPFTTGHGMAPFAGNPWFWGKFADRVVEELKVPVLLYSAAFGGSNMLQTFMSAKGEYFDHGFIRAAIRMPYINIENTILHLVPKTGIRAILSAHGINDNGSTEEEFYTNHKGVIDFSRSYENSASLTWMVANSCYNDGIKEQLHRAQERLIQLPNVFRGPNLNSIGSSGRTDRLHFNQEGQDKAAELWSEAVTNSDFLANSTPLFPNIPHEHDGSLPVKLIEFVANATDGGAIQVEWVTSEELNNSHFEVQYSFDGTQFYTGGTVKGIGNSEATNRYEYVLSGPFIGNIYLRLKQVDLDGTIDLSSVVSVAVNGATIPTFYPNPSYGVFTFAMPNHTTAKKIKVVDLAGIQVMEVNNTNEIDLSHLPASIYIAIVEGPDGMKTVKRISKI